nr:hypothetical protein [Tanacetum cinerariifolium]
HAAAAMGDLLFIYGGIRRVVAASSSSHVGGYLGCMESVMAEQGSQILKRMSVVKLYLGNPPAKGDMYAHVGTYNDMLPCI